MERHRHFLVPSRGSGQPTRVVGLAVGSEGEGAQDGTPLVTERLTNWAAAGWASQRDNDGVLWERSGVTASGLWESVDYALSRGGMTWCVSWRACRAWGLLGLWDRLEGGYVRFARASTDTGIAASAGPLVPAVPAVPDSADGVQRWPGQGDVQGLPAGRDSDSGKDHQRSSDRGNARSPIVIEDPPTVIGIRRPGLPGTLLIVDARNWGINAPDRSTPAQDEARQARDTVLRMIALLRSEGWGSLRATAGSQAWAVWLHNYYTHGVWVHTHQPTLDLEESAYVGGRCEARRLGPVKGPTYHLDYRSLYASVCARMPLPALHVSYAERGALDRLRAAPADIGHIAEVEVKTAEPAYPYRRDGETYYPVGCYRAVLCGPELDDALRCQRICSVGRVASYRLLPCLQLYAQSLWGVLSRVRSSGDHALSQWLKQLLVCLPGRCGQRSWEWLSAQRSGLYPLWGEWHAVRPDGGLDRWRSLAGYAEVERRGQWAPEAIPAMAAWVCSAGRMALLEAIRCAGWAEVYYYDTDAVIVSQRGYDRLVAQGRVADDTLGALRLLRRSESLEVYGIKHYAEDGVRTCAGLPRGDVVQSGIRDHYWYQRTPGAALRREAKPDVQLILQRYAREQSYRHGTVRPDGRVDPLEVWE